MRHGQESTTQAIQPLKIANAELAPLTFLWINLIKKIV